MDMLDKLQAILDRNKPVERMKKPFQVKGWLIATDGHALIAVKSQEGEPANASQQKIAKGALEFIAAKSTGDVLPMSLLRELAKSPGPPRTCGMCENTGSVQCGRCKGGGDVQCTCGCSNMHDMDCPDCNGSGSFSCGCGWSRRVRCRSFLLVEGVAYDAELLGDFLWPIEATEFRFTIPEQGKAWVIGGDDWRIAIIPMKLNDKADMKDAARLSLTQKAVAS